MPDIYGQTQVIMYSPFEITEDHFVDRREESPFRKLATAREFAFEMEKATYF